MGRVTNAVVPRAPHGIRKLGRLLERELVRAQFGFGKLFLDLLLEIDEFLFNFLVDVPFSLQRTAGEGHDVAGGRSLLPIVFVVLRDHAAVVSVVRVPLIGESILRVLILTCAKGRLPAPVMRLVVGLDRIFIQRSGSISTGHHL